MKITDDMIRAAAESISYPTVYMGGPSQGQKIQAKRFLEAIAPLVLEEAAKVAESPIFYHYVANVMGSTDQWEPGSPYDRGQRDRANEIAAAIRALKEPAS